MKNWQDLAYLLKGTERQREAYHAIQSLRVLEILKEYDPILVGTIPLDIDVESSDLDIICEVKDFSSFTILLQDSFGNQSGFRQVNGHIQGKETSVTNFFFAKFEFEIFGQPIPTKHQNAYRHMVIEDRLLTIGGEGAYKAIRKLKADGIKTEPAFVSYFQMECDDPYQELLDLERMTNEEIRSILIK